MIHNFKLGANALEILETGSFYGNMTTNKKFYPNNYTDEMRWDAFLNRRLNIGSIYGFDGHHMYMADQVHKTGSWLEIDQDYVSAHPNGWSDIPEDILIITDKTPRVVIGHSVADCPVVMAFDSKKKAVAVGHCSAELVDKRMPMLVVDALEESHASRDEDIQIYVSACAGKSWTYDRYPSWAKDSTIWNDVITMDATGLYHIDLRKAVLKQLKERNIGNIFMNPDDTITNPDYYSNSAGRVDSKKDGRNFAGVFFH